MLEDGGEHDQPAAYRPFPQNAGAADPEIRLAAGNQLGDLDVGAAFANGNVETGVAVEALLKGLIIARKLKLMLPFELN